MLGILSPTNVWTYIYKDVFDENDFNITVFGTFALDVFFFYLWGFLFLYPDLYGKPGWMIKYKVQPGTNQPVELSRIWEMLKVLFVNEIIVGFSFMVLLYPVQQYMGCSARPEDLPSVFTVIRDYYCFNVIEEIWFYYTHRLFHWGPLYRIFHKKHHEWTAPVGLATFYAHPLEHIIASLTTLYLGSVLMSTHLMTLWAWVIYARTSTVFHHSGYAIPNMPDPRHHDYHHEKFNGNYSGFMDWVHGTDLGFPGKEDPQKKVK